MYSELFTTSPYALFAVSLILGIANLLAVCIILSTKKLKQTFNDVILLILFACHLLCATFNIVLCVIVWTRLNRDADYSKAGHARDFILGLEIGLTIMLSVDRCIAVRKPFFYSRLGKKHAAFSFAILLALVSISFVLMLFSRFDGFLIASILTTLGGIFILIANVLLYRSVKKQCDFIASTIVESNEERLQLEQNAIRKRQLRSLKVCICITISYLLSWFPLMFAVGIYSILKIERGADTLVVLGMTNGIWDVLIYFKLNEKAKRRLLVLLRIHSFVRSNEVTSLQTASSAQISHIIH